MSINLSATALTLRLNYLRSPATMNFGTVSVGVNRQVICCLNNAGASDLDSFHADTHRIRISHDWNHNAKDHQR